MLLQYEICHLMVGLRDHMKLSTTKHKKSEFKSHRRLFYFFIPCYLLNSRRCNKKMKDKMNDHISGLKHLFLFKLKNLLQSIKQCCKQERVVVLFCLFFQSISMSIHDKQVSLSLSHICCRNIRLYMCIFIPK